MTEAKVQRLAREVFEERAAIAEFEGGLPRAEAERRLGAMTLLEVQQLLVEAVHRRVVEEGP